MQGDFDHSPKPPWNLINKRRLDQHVRIRVHMHANIAKETFWRKKESHWVAIMVISRKEAAWLFYQARAGKCVRPGRIRLNSFKWTTKDSSAFKMHFFCPLLSPSNSCWRSEKGQTINEVKKKLLPNAATFPLEVNFYLESSPQKNLERTQNQRKQHRSHSFSGKVILANPSWDTPLSKALLFSSPHN